MTRYQEFVLEFSLGQTVGVFIDDTGSPGLTTNSPNLHSERKSWVAVIVKPDHISEVIEQIPKAITELQKAIEAKEFHFVRIYGGRGEFSNASLDTRLALFRFMAFIFEAYRFPIIVQTFDPISLDDLHNNLNLPEKLGPFNFRKQSDAALFLLIWRIKDYVKSNFPEFKARVFIDEGFKRNGVAIKLPFWEDQICDGLLCFGKSNIILPLQLADFAAFCLNRTQILLNKPNLSDIDNELLQILSPIAWNYLNIDKIIKKSN